MPSPALLHVAPRSAGAMAPRLPRVARAAASALRLARALSLDVVAGALAGGMLAVQATGADMRPAWWVALASAVWVVYTADHLLDARRGRGHTLCHRHRVHRRHPFALGAALLLILALGLIAAARIRPPVIGLGLVLGACAAAYLASAQGRLLPRLPKEPVAGLLYACGIWGGPLLVTAPSAVVWLAAGLHALAAVLNLLANGALEAGRDLRHDGHSLAHDLGPTRIRVLVYAGALAAVATCLLAALARPELAPIFAVLAPIAATPGLLLAAPCLMRRERYRACGDLAFLLGALPRLLART